jgi:DNA topoisomerase-3
VILKLSLSKKKESEYAPKLFDLTGLQVYCNTKFGFTADETLKIVQTLYEQKVVTYPRVDTTFYQTTSIKVYSTKN